MKSAQEIVQQMYTGDAFSKWLGIRVLSNEPGSSKLSMTLREEMCNGFGIAHGGISYSLADSALAFAANGYGKHALSIETSISHHKPIVAGSEIFAEAKSIKEGRTLGVYQVLISNIKGELLASFKGTVLRKETTW
jgi:acyl-CoA thioesterase